MGQYNPQTQEIEGVDPVEVFIDGLTEHEFPSPDPEELGPTPYRFYDAGGDNLPYTLVSVLEYYYRQGRAVKVTVEDAGPLPTSHAAEEAAAARQRGLVALEAEARFRARNTHQSKY